MALLEYKQLLSKNIPLVISHISQFQQSIVLGNKKSSQAFPPAQPLAVFTEGNVSGPRLFFSQGPAAKTVTLHSNL